MKDEKNGDILFEKEIPSRSFCLPSAEVVGGIQLQGERARAPCLIGDVIIVTVDGLVVVGQSWARESISTFSVVNFYF